MRSITNALTFRPGCEIDEHLRPRARPGRPSVHVNALHRIGSDELQRLLRQDQPRHGAAPTGPGGRRGKVLAGILGEPGQSPFTRAHLGLLFDVAVFVLGVAVVSLDGAVVILGGAVVILGGPVVVLGNLGLAVVVCLMVYIVVCFVVYIMVGIGPGTTVHIGGVDTARGRRSVLSLG